MGNYMLVNQINFQMVRWFCGIGSFSFSTPFTSHTKPNLYSRPIGTYIYMTEKCGPFVKRLIYVLTEIESLSFFVGARVNQNMAEELSKDLAQEIFHRDRNFQI